MGSINGTELNGRVLWFDGDSSFDLETLYKYILEGNPVNDKMFVREMGKDVIKYNAMNPNRKLNKKDELKDLDQSWNIPDKYKSLNIKNYILTQLLENIEENDFTESEISEREERVLNELKLFNDYGMNDLLRTVIYIVEEFRKNNVVWGTGRGSSCCSYCLYLIGLHEVDSVKYDLDLKEFFR